MTVDSVRGYCLSFPQARENLQWGETLCFKVAGKIFALLSLASVPQSLCFKCTPEKFVELVERDGIRPAPYVGRYKWALLERLDVLGDQELEDLIRQSYEMVAAKSKGKAKVKSRKPGESKSTPKALATLRPHSGHAPDAKGMEENGKASARTEGRKLRGDR